MNVQAFLDTLDSKRTVITYRRGLELFDEFSAGDITSDLEDFSVWLKTGKKLSASSVQLYLSAVRAFIRWSVQKKQISAEVYSAATAVRGPKKTKKVLLPLTPNEIDQLLDSINLETVDGARDYAFILFALNTGARIDEALGLQIEQIDFDRNCGIVLGKGDKERIVYFDDDTKAALVFYLSKRNSPNVGPVFVNPNGYTLTARAIQLRLKAYGDNLGIAVHPHKLRRTFAVNCLNATRDIHSVSKLMGHTNIRATEHYTDAATEHLRAVALAGTMYRRGTKHPDSIEGERISIWQNSAEHRR